MKFTKIPANTFKEMQMNAGVLLKTFNPATASAQDIVTNAIGATSGGVSFADAVSFTDFGEDIDNCPKNTKELKRVESHEVTLSGTYVTVNSESLKGLVGMADSSTESKQVKITPRNDLNLSDFADIWWVGDYSNTNDDTNGNFIAIHLIDALSTGGFQLTTGDKSKGQFPFTYTGHYGMDDPDKVPYEIYISKVEE